MNGLGWPDRILGGNYAETLLFAHYAGGLVIAELNTAYYKGRVNALNMILLNRNGPYGYPSWKQIRGGQHPVARRLRRRNTISWAAQETVHKDLISGETETTYLTRRITNQVETPVTSKYKPIVHNVNVKKSLFTDETANAIIQHSYGNQKTYFTEKIPGFHSLNNNSSIVWGPNWQNQNDNKPLPYDSLKYLTVGGEISKETNPIDSVISVNVKEVIFPREKYTYLKKVRQRSFFAPAGTGTVDPNNPLPAFSASNVDRRGTSTFWKNSRSDRTKYGSNLIPGPAARLSSDQTLQHSVGQNYSCWELDAREFFSTGTVVSGTPDNQSITKADLYGDVLGEPSGTSYGVLQNNLMFLFPFGAASADRTPMCPTYIRPWPEDRDETEIFGGDTKWEAGDQAGVTPFYETYDEWAEDLRGFQDYGIIPEFRISEHMEYYVNERQGDFLAPASASFTLTGSSGSAGERGPRRDSNSVPLGLSDPAFNPSYGNDEIIEFSKVYTHSDFMKYFGVVKNDYKGKLKPTEITLTCNAIMKFLPYKGLYPAQRTVELTRLFWNSYGKELLYTGPLADVVNLVIPDTLGLGQERFPPIFARPIYQAMFSPGILYNSIKSGLAVDYPIYTGSFNITGVYYDPADTNDSGIPRLSGNFHHRVPFEALLEPENPKYLGGIPVVDQECHPSASYQRRANNLGLYGHGFATASLKSVASPLYKMGMHNFLAETVDFFLDGGKLTTFGSLPDKHANFGVVNDEKKTYMMKLVCSNSTIRSTQTLKTLLERAPHTLQSASFKHSPPLITMYQRTGSKDASSFATRAEVYGSSFGPPCDTVGTLNPSKGVTLDDNGITDPLYTSASFAPFTPPYYDGYSQIVFAFKPSFTGKHTLADIYANLSASVDTIPTIGGDGLSRQWMRQTTDQCVATASQPNMNKINAMMLTASVNHLQATNLKYVEYSKSGKIKTVKDDPDAPSQWFIQPKWETPVLDFAGAECTLPVSGSGSVAKGMWHQYGEVATRDRKGIWLELQDIAEEEKEVPHLTGSLADLVGFNTSPKRIGQLRGTKEVSEAVVAVPFFIDEDNQKTRFTIDPEAIELAEMFIDGQIDEYNSRVEQNPLVKPSVSIIEMVKKMRKFVFPPRMDFLTNRKADDTPGGFTDPFAMFVFEFKQTFSRTDLSRLWQNLPPENGYMKPYTAQKTSVSIPAEIFKFKPQAANVNPILGTAMMDSLPENVQWEVFKVKQRAKYNYFAKTADTRDDDRFKFKFQSDADTKEGVPNYSYNWPYDYFSLVELVKLEADVTLSSEADVTFPTPPGKSDEEVAQESDELVAKPKKKNTAAAAKKKATGKLKYKAAAKAKAKSGTGKKKSAKYKKPK